jgi:signal transduction histidine kinase
MRTEIEVNLRDREFNLDKSKRLLKSNLEEIEKLENLSGALLRLARFQENSKKEYEEVSLEDAFCEAYEKIEKLANKKSIKFDNRFMKLSVLGDHQSLVQLFVILLDNAVKYSPEKSKVSISIKKEKHNAVIRIKDKGCGISETDLPNIFDRFYRADSSRCKVVTDGYGLGLSIAKQIVETHGGKIKAISDGKKGSEFVVKLPSI